MFTWRVIIPVCVITLWYSFVPEAVQAQNGFVSCEGTWNDPCDFCDLVSTARNILDFLITIAVIIAVIIIVFAGLRLTTSAGNVAAKDAAKGYMTNAIIGLILVLISWLIIDTIMKVLVDQEVGAGGQDFGVWHRIECRDQPTPQEVSMQVEIANFGDLSDIDISDRSVGGAGYAGGECAVIDDSDNDCHSSNLSCFGQHAQQASEICNMESGGESVMSGTDKCSDGRSFSGGPFQVNVIAHADKIPGCNSSSFRTGPGLGGSRQPQGGCARYVTNSNGVRYCAVWDCTFTSQSGYDSCVEGALDSNLNTDIACDLFDETNGFDPWRISAQRCGITHGVQ